MTAAERATARAEDQPPPPPPVVEPRDAAADLWAADLAKALADVRAKLGADRTTKRAPLFDIDGACLLGEEFTDSEYLVSGLITRGGQVMIGGLPKAAKKTWLATEIAVAIATGTKVCGEFLAAAGSVAYFYAEDMPRQVRNRVRALLAGAGRSLPHGRLRLQSRGAFLDVMTDEDLAWIVASARRLGPLGLLVLDPLRDVHSGEEDASDSMRDVMRRLRVLGVLLGCTVLAVHHAGKPSEATGKRGGGQRLRGSGAIHGSIDSGIYILDTDGDGIASFKMTVESEIKGARSAGIFSLALEIEDDHRGEAVRATWKHGRIEGKRGKESAKAAQDAGDDDRAFTFVRELAMRGEQCSRTALRNHDEKPIGEKRLMTALDRLIETGRLAIENRRVAIPGSNRGDNS